MKEHRTTCAYHCRWRLPPRGVFSLAERRRNRLVVGLALAIAAWPGCSKNEVSQPSPTVTVQVATVGMGKIDRTISTDAVIFPLRQAALTPKISAPVHRFLVERGDHVHAGELLAELDNQDLAASVTDNKGAYEQAQAAYETATRQSMPEEIQKAELDAKAAHDSMLVAQKLYTSQQNLFQQGATARKNVEDANLAYIQARNQYEIANKHLESMSKFGKEQEFKAAEGQLTSARGKYLGAQAQLGFAEMRSPIDGVVTDRPLYAGEMAATGTPLITVMDLSQVVARCHIDPQQATALRVGDAASILAMGSANSIPGKVTMVGPAADPGSTTVEVWVQSANAEGVLRPGVTTKVMIIAETALNVVLIPPASVLTAPGGNTSVMVIDGENKAHSQSVKIGIRGKDSAQVIEGLQPGERVATVGAYDLFTEDPDVLVKTKLQIYNPSEAAPE